ncbi:MAG: lysostaphin resistance A-like protein [Candidatus Krumholzibacteriia bacterium]
MHTSEEPEDRLEAREDRLEDGPERTLFDRLHPSALLLLVLGCLILYGLAAERLWGGRPGLGVWGLALAPLLGIAPVFAVLRHMGLPVREELWLVGLSPRQLLGVFLALAGTLPWAYAAGALNSELTPPEPESFEYFRSLIPTDTPSFIGAFMAVVVMVPLGEEVVFRILVLGVFRRHMPASLAVLITGVLFGAAHIAPWLFLPISLLGMVLGILTLITRSLTAAWIGHALFNLFALVQLVQTGDAETTRFDRLAMQPWVLAAGGLLAVGGLLAARSTHDGPRPETAEHRDEPR